MEEKEENICSEQKNVGKKSMRIHPQKWSTDLHVPGYRIGIPIGIALRK